MAGTSGKFFPVCDATPNAKQPVADATAYCLVKACPTGNIPFADILKAGTAPLDFGPLQTVIILPSKQTQLSGAGGTAMADLRTILRAEAQLLDKQFFRVWSLRVDPLIAMSKLGELGFSAMQFGVNSDDGVHTWTLIHEPKSQGVTPSAALSNGEKSDLVPHQPKTQAVAPTAALSNGEKSDFVHPQQQTHVVASTALLPSGEKSDVVQGKPAKCVTITAVADISAVNADAEVRPWKERLRRSRSTMVRNYKP